MLAKQSEYTLEDETKRIVHLLPILKMISYCPGDTFQDIPKNE